MKISEMGMTGYWPKEYNKRDGKRVSCYQPDKEYENSLSKDQQEKKKADIALQQVSAAEIYQRMHAEDKNRTDTEIIVKPDGSRVLVMTMHIGSMETTMSMEISKPTDMQNDKGREADSGEEAESNNSEIAAAELEKMEDSL
ncbi:MAG: hypothetical protein HFH41_00905 [Lachnospiraceae bacterium]|nr:hypothetical protein [Lachnospiraceae bacterium]